MSTKSRKRSKPAKSTVPSSKPSTTPSRKTLPSTDSPSSPAAKPSLVRMHDLSSGACIFLPVALRDILGEEDYQTSVTALESQTLTLIVRGSDDVIYVELSVTVLDDARTSSSTSLLTTAPVKTKPARKKAGRS